MPNYFELVAEKMAELGFFNYLFPFLILLALLYAILRKSKLVENKVAAGILSLAISFMVVFGFPLATGFELGSPFSAFFMQASVFILVFFIGLVTASLFYPNLMEKLPKLFVRRTTLFAMIAIAFVLFISSGLVGVFTTGLAGGGGGGISTDIIMLAVAVFLAITFVLIGASISRGGEG